MKRALALGFVSCVIVACGGATVSDIYSTDFDGGPSFTTSVDSGKAVDGSNNVDGAAQKDAGNNLDSGSVDSSSADTGVVGAPCTVQASPAGTSVDCTVAGYACFAPNCITGTCMKVSTTASDYSPVCGCDTINYWNAGAALNEIAAIKATGKCTSPLQCTGAPGSATCQALGTMTCEFVSSTPAGICLNPPTGTCWGLPDTCPTTTSGVTSCAPGGACTTLCDAITNQTVYRGGTTCKAN